MGTKVLIRVFLHSPISEGKANSSNNPKHTWSQRGAKNYLVQTRLGCNTNWPFSITPTQPSSTSRLLCTGSAQMETETGGKVQKKRDPVFCKSPDAIVNAQPHQAVSNKGDPFAPRPGSFSGGQTTIPPDVPLVPGPMSDVLLDSLQETIAAPRGARAPFFLHGPAVDPRGFRNRAPPPPLIQRTRRYFQPKAKVCKSGGCRSRRPRSSRFVSKPTLLLPGVRSRPPAADILPVDPAGNGRDRPGGF